MKGMSQMIYIKINDSVGLCSCSSISLSFHEVPVKIRIGA